MSASATATKIKPTPMKVWVLKGNPDGGALLDGDYCEGFATKKEAVVAAVASARWVS